MKVHSKWVLVSRFNLAASVVTFLVIAVVLMVGQPLQILSAGEAKPFSYLINGGFERGAVGWTLGESAQVSNEGAHGGKMCLKIQSGGAQQDVFGLPIGETFTCTAYIKVQDVQETAKRGYAYMAVYQLGEFGELVAFHDFVQKVGTFGWQRHSYTFKVEEECKFVSVRCGLFQAKGTAWFDDLTLTAGEEPIEYEQVVEDGMLMTQIPGLERKSKGNVAIYKDDIPPSGAASSPDYLASVVKGAGFGVAFLNSEQLADRKFLNRATFDVLILPYGASFPVKASDNFRRFLRSGGKFLSIGGYAFDNLLERTEQGWQKPSPPPPEVSEARWHYQIPAEELRDKGPLTFSGFLKAFNVSGAGFAFFAVYQYAADGSLPQWRDVCHVVGSQDWREFRYTFSVNPKAEIVDLHAGLYRCQGVAWFDDIKLTDESGNVLLLSDFEQDFNLDARVRRNWWRSDQQLCTLDKRATHSGKRALKVKLRYQAPTEERLNTRHGVPADGLEVAPTQLGVFDPDYRLERVRYARGAPAQTIVDPNIRIDGSLEGYAACGVVGFNTGRWVPLINAYDKYGRLRGAVGALLRHYGATYAGSSWAFFGVTNRDLFAHSERAMADALVNIVCHLVEDVYFTHLVSELDCYRQGETVKLVAPVFNGGRAEKKLRVTFEIYEGRNGGTGEFENERVGEGRNRNTKHATQNTKHATQNTKHATQNTKHATQNTKQERRRAVLRKEVEIFAVPGMDTEASIEWKPKKFASDFYHVIAKLNITHPLLREEKERTGVNEFDRIESGFIVWDETVVANGPKLRYHNNYLHYGEKPLFMFGTDDWSYVFSTNRETPLQWWEDMEKRRDFGVMIYENLQFGLPSSPEEQERLLRKVDGVVQLAQKFQQVYFPCLLCGFNVAVSDEELSRQKEFCRSYAKRYAKVPGLIYYLNGDLRCQLSEAVTPQWNEFLRQRYGTTERLRQAWGEKAPTQQIGQIPAQDFNDWGQEWDDVKIYDLNCFRAWLIRRWMQTLIEGIREFDKAHPTTAEFYQLPHQGVDVLAGIDGLDLSNFGYFDRPNADIQRFPAICKYNDLRARGKSLGPGEYGVKTHPAWGDGKDYGYHTTRTREQAVELFLAIAHYSLGLGASRIQNWCWKDGSHHIFPWGMNYPCDNVEKDTLYVHRNQSLLFRHFSPVYEEGEVYVLTADSHRLGGGKWQVIEGILRGIDIALATHVDNLGTLNEQYLNLNMGIPKKAKVIFYPLPFCPPDEAYEKILNWVKQGGVLYLSGDISYDEWRRRTRTQRLEELCGVRFIAENYPNIQVNASSAEDQPCIKVETVRAKVLKSAKDGSPLIVENTVGKGRVIFTTDPIELHSTPQRRSKDAELYRNVLKLGGIKPIEIAPDDPLIHAFRVPMQDGGQVYVLFNTDEREPTRQVTLSIPHLPRRQTAGVRMNSQVTLTIVRRRPALVWFDGKGCIRAVEAQGQTLIGGHPHPHPHPNSLPSRKRELLDTTTNVILFTLDGRDIRDSEAIVAMPLAAGGVSFANRRKWKQPFAEVGEVRGSLWRSFEPVSLNIAGGKAKISVTADQALNIILICERNRAPRWRKVVERSTNKPATAR